ncbi:MAG TPA: tetratricopeptide repeat protein, partial [Blastocatellia bacterium]
RNQGLVEEAIEEYKKALRLARNASPEAHIGLGIAYRESNELSEAIKAYYAGLAQDMDTEPILYYHLAEMLESQQRNKEAIAAYENYIRLDPEGEFATAAQSIIDRLKEEKQ